MGDSPEFDTNQLRAWESWNKVADAIVYLNEPQPQLRSAKTRFYDSEPYPRIMELAEVCACQPEWSCIINSDIVVLPKFIAVEKQLKAKKACAATSWRYEFDPARGLEPAAVVDCGLDFFAATPEIWRRFHAAVPEELRLGSGWWDTFTLSWFFTFATHGFYEITPARVIFHPRHNSRRYGPPVDHTKLKLWGHPIMPHLKL